MTVPTFSSQCVVLYQPVEQLNDDSPVRATMQLFIDRFNKKTCYELTPKDFHNAYDATASPLTRLLLVPCLVCSNRVLTDVTGLIRSHNFPEGTGNIVCSNVNRWERTDKFFRNLWRRRSEGFLLINRRPRIRFNCNNPKCLTVTILNAFDRGRGRGGASFADVVMGSISQIVHSPAGAAHMVLIVLRQREPADSHITPTTTIMGSFQHKEKFQEVVDVVFTPRHGVYKCSQNDDAVRQLAEVCKAIGIRPKASTVGSSSNNNDDSMGKPRKRSRSPGKHYSRSIP